MSMMNEWDNVFKEKLGAFEEAPPTYMWDKIASGIPSTTTKVAFYKTTNFRVFVAAASIIILLFFSWLWLESSKHNELQFTNKNINNKIENSITHKDTLHNSGQNEYVKQQKLNTEKADLQKHNLVKNQSSLSKNNEALPLKSKLKKHIANINKTYHVVANDSNVTTQNIITQNKLNKVILADENIIASNKLSQDSNKNSHPKISAEIISSAIATLQVNENNYSNTQQTEKSTYENTNIKEVKTENAISNETEENSIISENIVTAEIIKIDKPTTTTSLDTANDKVQDSGFHPQTRDFNRLGFGLHYGIENIKAGDNELISNNIDLSFNYQNLNFILQSGVGIQFSQDDRDYNLEYIRNDYLATEMRFDSAIFVMDSAGQVNFVPVNPYYTDVYDSIYHTYNSYYYEKYYSIRIPVMIGYKKDLKNIDLYAKGGILLSRVIYKQKKDIYETDEYTRIIKLDYLGSDRVFNQIQYVLSAGLAYNFNKNIQFNGEIMTKFYQNSLYDNKAYANINTWSLEARVGFIYFLN